MKLPAGMLIVATVLFILVAAPLSAAELISYQGRLTSGGLPVADSTYSVTFGLYRDSTGGSSLWQEVAPVTTESGLFVHRLGSVTPLQSALFVDNGRLFLAVTVDGQQLAPRTRLTSSPTSVAASQLRITDNSGIVVGKTESSSGGVLQLNNSAGATKITLHGGRPSDSSVVLPDSAINADEILNEPGIASQNNQDIMDLSTGTMTDIALVEIEIPSDGYVVLYGKCYAVLSGTTGPNGAVIQIDETEGGPPLFPYYTQAGMSGFVNSGTNYFPAFVSRVYFKEAGTYEFRLEGKATHPLPAIAQTWDHILTAMYFPTSYGWISGTTLSPDNNPTAIPVELNDSRRPDRNGVIYNLDLRWEERSSKEDR